KSTSRPNTAIDHGSLTHRLQWHLVMLEMTENPGAFAAAGESPPSASELFKTLGDPLLRHLKWNGTGGESQQDLWYYLFDDRATSFTKPEFFRFLHGFWPGIGEWY